MEILKIITMAQPVFGFFVFATKSQSFFNQVNLSYPKTEIPSTVV